LDASACPRFQAQSGRQSGRWARISDLPSVARATRLAQGNAPGAAQVLSGDNLRDGCANESDHRTGPVIAACCDLERLEEVLDGLALALEFGPGGRLFLLDPIAALEAGHHGVAAVA